MRKISVKFSPGVHFHNSTLAFIYIPFINVNNTSFLRNIYVQESRRHQKKINNLHKPTTMSSFYNWYMPVIFIYYSPYVDIKSITLIKYIRWSYIIYCFLQQIRHNSLHLIILNHNFRFTIPIWLSCFLQQHDIIYTQIAFVLVCT